MEKQKTRKEHCFGYCDDGVFDNRDDCENDDQTWMESAVVTHNTLQYYGVSDTIPIRKYIPTHNGLR